MTAIRTHLTGNTGVAEPRRTPRRRPHCDGRRRCDLEGWLDRRPDGLRGRPADPSGGLRSSPRQVQTLVQWHQADLPLPLDRWTLYLASSKAKMVHDLDAGDRKSHRRRRCAFAYLCHSEARPSAIGTAPDPISGCSGLDRPLWCTMPIRGGWLCRRHQDFYVRSGALLHSRSTARSSTASTSG